MEQKRFLPEQTQSGLPFPLGATKELDGFNFAVFSESEVLELVIASYESPHEQISIPLNRTGSVWHTFYKTEESVLYYAYRIKYGDSPRLALDPYARLIQTNNIFGKSIWNEKLYEQKPLGIAFRDSSFDWEGDTPLRLDPQDLIVYEMHVRGLTEHSSSQTSFKGTYQGVIDSIPHLKELGVNAVELLPLHEFNESENYRVNPLTNAQLCNFWGIQRSVSSHRCSAIVQVLIHLLRCMSISAWSKRCIRLELK